ncbi:MAG: hypothetical protein NWS20_02925 [Rickettsiaceae bacterium]|nr:hypothetical protein [Rickettsiaceae bacterium]MDP4832477.1 hypothetical protein [Rickettsiaceae bacterium]MDP5020775.1 hypothetical protein [Rickettsiaceae bacterium]MDP5083307.1 hypothetical protein [Rickettsiaceae bacterium]
MSIKKMISRFFKWSKNNESAENNNNYSELAQNNVADKKVTTTLILDSLKNDTFWSSSGAIDIPKDLLEYFVDPEMMQLIDHAVDGFAGQEETNSHLLAEAAFN